METVIQTQGFVLAFLGGEATIAIMVSPKKGISFVSYALQAFLDLSNGTAQEGNVTTNSTWQYFSWPQRSSDLLIFSVNLTSSGK